jgi:formate hydrogenlyase subunit 4
VLRLLKKGEVISQSCSFIFDLAPSLYLASILTAATLIPFGNYKSLICFQGDYILFAYLLAMAKFFSVLAALDTGSSFEGMGASRELSFTVFLEPAFIAIMASLVYATGLGSMSELVAYHTISINNEWSVIISVLTTIALFIMLLIEGCRVPFDDPNTHLELTMIHEVMILDTSGVNLAFVIYGSALKMTIYASLISYFLIPWGKGLWLVTGLYFIIMTGLAVAIGVIEALMPRFRMTRNLELAIIPFSIALLILSALIVNQIGGM